MGAKEWKRVKKDEPGFYIWRIEKFKVKRNRQAEETGGLFKDDSYIVLNVYKKDDVIKMDVHFWLGETTSQDEAGTAAYKTVELDDYLDDLPVQHREVCGYESSMFLSYFKNGIRLLEGGVASGFNHVKPETYEPRLLWVKGSKHVRSVQVPIEIASLNSGDVFILDAGLNLYQYQGKACGKMEKLRSAISTDTGGDDHDFEKDDSRVLLRLSDASGTLEFKEEGKGADISKDMLDTNDVFIFDAGSELFVWVGKGASDNEKGKAFSFASKYLTEHDRPPHLPTTQIYEGGENEYFEALF